MALKYLILMDQAPKELSFFNKIWEFLKGVVCYFCKSSEPKLIQLKQTKPRYPKIDELGIVDKFKEELRFKVLPALRNLSAIILIMKIYLICIEQSNYEDEN